MRRYCPCCHKTVAVQYEYDLEIWSCVNCGEDLDHKVEQCSEDKFADRMNNDILRYG